jgi:hypothetical protein
MPGASYKSGGCHEKFINIFVGKRRDFTFLHSKSMRYWVKEKQMDFKELFDAIDSRLVFQPETLLASLALELGVSVKDIEEAVRETEGLSFREYCENRRLAHVLGAVEPGMLTREDSVFADQRVHLRWTIPGAVVRYLVGGLGNPKAEFSLPFPILDISRGGMAFFSNHSGKPGREISLLVSLVKEENEVRVEGKIVYSAAVGGVAGYEYRIGVCFHPFAIGKGFNAPEIEKVLNQLEKRARSLKKNDHGDSSPST